LTARRESGRLAASGVRDVSQADPYLLGYRQAEQQRLERQAHELGSESAWLFDQIGVREGWRVVEIGCGPLGCLHLLSERVGEVRLADARDTGLPAGSFDLATARLVLVNVPQPEQIVAEMVRLVRPGGVVALHEAESTTQRCDPPHPAQSRLLRILESYAEQSGIDRSIGLRAPRMLRDAGLLDVRANPLVHVYPPGHPRRMLVPEFVENTRPRILEKQLVGEVELDALTADLRRHLEDPTTLVVSSLFIQAWGRTPDR